MSGFPPDTMTFSFSILYPAAFVIICYIFRNERVFGRSLKEYLWPIRYYILGAMVTVALQYLALDYINRFVDGARVTQALWALMVALSTITLVQKYNFKFKNVLALGVFFSLIIHGFKCSMRYFVYGAFDPLYRTPAYISSRFIYGSILVMVISIVVALLLYLNNEFSKEEKNAKKISLIILGITSAILILFVASEIYRIHFWFY